MGIEFDSKSSTYWQTAYTGASATRGEPTELPPSMAEEVGISEMERSLTPEELKAATTITDPALEISDGSSYPTDPALAVPDPFDTYDPTMGSLVDTVV